MKNCSQKKEMKEEKTQDKAEKKPTSLLSDEKTSAA